MTLVEEANALLAPSSPRAGLDEIHLRALRVLVAELQKQKCAVTTRPWKSSSPALRSSAASHAVPAKPAPLSSAPSNPAPSSSAEPNPASHSPAASSPVPSQPGLPSKPRQYATARLKTAKQPKPPRQRGRHVPAALRRAVFERDAGRCTYVSASGERCTETHGLEVHHLRAFALGGQHSENNLTLRCRAHNALAAEEELGREFVEQQRDSLGHESFAEQRLRD